MALRTACTDGSRFAAYGLIGFGSTAADFSGCTPTPPRVSAVSGPGGGAAGEEETAAVATSAGLVPPATADPIPQIATALACQSSTQATQSGKMQKLKWSGCNSDAEIEVVRLQERLTPDRAMPELWIFFRRFGN